MGKKVQGKYHTDQGNKNNTNVRRITIMQKEQEQELGQ
jgi:hypothetical protein